MNQYVTDTMAVVLYLEKRRMPQPVKQIFQSADVGLCNLFIPAIAVAEIGYLSEKGRISLSLADLKQYLNLYAAYQF